MTDPSEVLVVLHFGFGKFAVGPVAHRRKRALAFHDRLHAARPESPVFSSACSPTARLSPNAPFRPPMESRQPTSRGSLTSAPRYTRIRFFSLAHPKSVSKSFPHLTPHPRSTRNALST